VFFQSWVHLIFRATVTETAASSLTGKIPPDFDEIVPQALQSF
jgi:hypothetical protein